MDCPVCENPMIVLELKDVEIDFCTECQGIWLDAGELDQLLADHQKTLDLMHSFSEHKESTEEKRKCPICSKKMLKILVGGKQPPLPIDLCSKDHGLWFDAGQLHDIIERANLDEENKIIDILNEMFPEGNANEAD